MSRRFTTRLKEPAMKLLLSQAEKEKKSISETIEEVVSNALLHNEKDEINSLASSVQELSMSLASLKKDFQIHKDNSEREFQIIMNLLVMTNEIAKHILPQYEYECAWQKYHQKHEEYKTTGRIRI